MKPRLLCLTIALTISSISCGNSKKLYPVSGKVVYQGKPEAGAFVFLHRVGMDSAQEETIMGVVQTDGSFVIDTGSIGKGVAPGEYAVFIKWSDIPKPAEAGFPGAVNATQRRSDKFNGRYSDPERLLLHAQIKTGKNVLPTIELID